MSGKRWLARAIWDVVTTGEVTLPNGKRLILEPAMWLDVVKFLHVHIDGPAKTDIGVDLSGQGNIVLTWADAQGDSAAAPSGADGSTG